MAKLIDIDTKEEREVNDEDNESLKIKAEELGVVFGCEDGNCLSCRVKVIDGTGNLSERTQNEKDLDIEEPNRLICQCRIKQGSVTIKI